MVRRRCCIWRRGRTSRCTSFSEKEIFTNGVLSAELATLLAGPIMQALAELPEEVACVHRKDLETHVACVCEKGIGRHTAKVGDTRVPSSMREFQDVTAKLFDKSCEVFPLWVPRVTDWKLALAEDADRVAQVATPCTRSNICWRNTWRNWATGQRIGTIRFRCLESACQIPQMFKGCASQIDKALGVVLDLRCRSKEGMSSALGLCASTQQPRHNVQAILDLFEKMHASLVEKKHFEELGGNVDARLGHAEFSGARARVQGNAAGRTRDIADSERTSSFLATILCGSPRFYGKRVSRRQGDTCDHNLKIL